LWEKAGSIRIDKEKNIASVYIGAFLLIKSGEDPDYEEDLKSIKSKKNI